VHRKTLREIEGLLCSSTSQFKTLTVFELEHPDLLLGTRHNPRRAIPHQFRRHQISKITASLVKQYV